MTQLESESSAQTPQRSEDKDHVLATPSSTHPTASDSRPSTLMRAKLYRPRSSAIVGANESHLIPSWNKARSSRTELVQHWLEQNTAPSSSADPPANEGDDSSEALNFSESYALYQDRAYAKQAELNGPPTPPGSPIPAVPADRRPTEHPAPLPPPRPMIPQAGPGLPPRDWAGRDDRRHERRRSPERTRDWDRDRRNRRSPSRRRDADEPDAEHRDSGRRSGSASPSERHRRSRRWEDDERDADRDADSDRDDDDDGRGRRRASPPRHAQPSMDSRRKEEIMAQLRAVEMAIAQKKTQPS
ncbi:uncharacterized protein MONBRDRAFT_31387 [Monosiga brevicollis MX1]|uniref:Uncharacterized protein n=1 Tax=Monosiga brevicollis TaxID=81824 RepID=A9USW2_MONBE|nr:uncharacterized protein MONBRDRAFT_31387 [Monosiga brevicollis MX1]EDQ91136.1 predicted protein [Monosiga brevicollis MX1]|eukprot:XP_001743558.1 hypothetical protein [Monosiga brevicollis MX1]